MKPDCCNFEDQLAGAPKTFTITAMPGPATEPDWEMIRELNPGLMATITYTDPENGLEVRVEMDPERATRRLEEITGQRLYPSAS